MLDPGFIIQASLYRAHRSGAKRGCTLAELAADAEARGLKVDIGKGVDRLLERKFAVRRNGTVKLTPAGIRECERLYW